MIPLLAWLGVLLFWLLLSWRALHCGGLWPLAGAIGLCVFLCVGLGTLGPIHDAFRDENIWNARPDVSLALGGWMAIFLFVPAAPPKRRQGQQPAR